LYLKVDKAKIEGQTKVKIIKVIRTELEKIINTFDSDEQTNEYLKGLIDFLDQNAQPKQSDEEGNTLKPSSKLEIELKAISRNEKLFKKSLCKQNSQKIFPSQVETALLLGRFQDSRNNRRSWAKRQTRLPFINVASGNWVRERLDR
jgi:hypothetical protein